MTKQEEIREGIADCLPGAGDTTTNLWDTVDRILNYLQSQGMVLKVENEVLDNFTITITEGKQSVTIPFSILKNAGFAAWKPLLKE